MGSTVISCSVGVVCSPYAYLGLACNNNVPFSPVISAANIVRTFTEVSNSHLVFAFPSATATAASFTPTVVDAATPYWAVLNTYENMTMYSFAVGTPLTSSITNNQ